MHKQTKQRGFTLLEVLIAVLIFSIGLLGSAGLMVLSVRTNHSAYLRTQASFLADSMVERMRANADQANAYNDTYDSSTANDVDPCATVSCSPAALVARDKALWSRQLVDSLPSASAQITCTGTSSADGLGLDPGMQAAAPYNGQCTMTITWVEADLDRSSGGTPATQTFAWVFQP